MYIKVKILLILACALQALSVPGLAQIKEPYKQLHGGGYFAPNIRASPDPLITYRWNDPKVTDSLQVYSLDPKTVKAFPSTSFKINKDGIAVMGTGSVMLDFGMESAGWIEFESNDLIDSVEVSISEYNEPAILNSGAQHPVKTKVPTKYGNTYRLELNDALYEGVRFAWIHVNTFSQPWHIRNVKLVCQVRPVNYNGSFHCSDAELNRIWYTGAYVVKLNLLQDYFGAILMERSDRHSWTGDAYPAQAAALAAFGNYDVIKKNIAYTSSQDNGIAAYSLYWVLSLIDYYNYTGDIDFLKEYMSNADKRLERAYKGYDQLPRLNFMGWDEGLGAGFENPQTEEAQNTYRMLCINTWKQFAEALSSINEEGLSSKYRHFAASKIQLLHSETQLQNYGVHAVAEAINAGLLDNKVIYTLAKELFADRLNRLSYSPFNQYFILQAMSISKQYDAALTSIKDLWGGQINYGGTTFFEVFRPSWNSILNTNDAPPNNQCGYTSLAHPWSAGVTKWISENVLGIQPAVPGFKRFNIVPYFGNTLSQVEGSMPTPFGIIKASFNTKKGTGFVHVPASTIAQKIGLPKGDRNIKKVMVNGVLLWKGSFNKVRSIDASEEDDNYIYLLNVAPGDYEFEITYSGSNKLSEKPLKGFNYPVTTVKQDSITSGGWNKKYGREGFVLFGYEKDIGEDLPTYVNTVNITKNGLVIWDSLHLSPAILRPLKGVEVIASAIITRDPEPTFQTMTIDIELKESHPYKLSLYFLDYDSKDRRSAIEVFDLKTLNIIAPVQMIANYHNGKYITFSYNKSIRVRVNHVRGKNAAVSGVFFDKQ